MELWNDIMKMNGTKKQLREFGLLVGGVLTVLGGLLLWRQKEIYWLFGSIGLVLIAGGLTVPLALKHLYKVWMSLALCMGWVMTRVILSVLFYLVISPISLISRLFGAKYLDLSFKSSDDSCWIMRQHQPSHESYEKQF
ncbi:MAG: SxtJ family membrane protein [Candidatus Omnitrophota bacterium]|nr:SxtJ family membrane protein [Candidatus Omnitrophota bacterium]